jgi:hypothetical protein
MTLSRSAWGGVFLAKGLYNLVVSVALLIWAGDLLPLMGPPPGNPVYAQMFLLLCAAFGIGYLAVSFNVDENAGIVVMGIIGQLSVFGVVVCQWSAGNVYGPALISGLVDLAFASAFVIFLYSHHYPVRSLAR